MNINLLSKPIKNIPRVKDCGYIPTAVYCGYIGLILMTLTACTTVSQPISTQISSPTIEHSKNFRAAKLQSWDIRGKIGVQTKQKGWNASFNWLQNNNDYSLDLFGPLGANRVSLSGNRRYAILKTGNQIQEASNAEALLKQRLGWYLPVNNIYYWIRGIPAPGHFNKLLRNDDHETQILDQQNWHITYKSYQKINGVNLPTLIELENPNIFIRIAIDQWDL